MNEKIDKKIQDKSSVLLSTHYSGSPTKKNETTTRANRVAFKNSNPASLDLEQNHPERYTPDTSLGDFEQDIFDDENIKPDLSVICKLCRQHILLDELRDHKDYHNALSYFGYKTAPEDFDELSNKRKLLVKTISSKYFKRAKDIHSAKANEWSLKITQINEAYEIIKAHLLNSYESNRRWTDQNLKIEAQGESRVVSNPSIIAVGTCVNQNKPHKLSMEDTNIILESFGENENFTYIGTFDGYEGDVASNKCINQLHLALLDSLSKTEMNIEFIREKYLYDEINNLEKFAKETLDLNESSKTIFDNEIKSTRTSACDIERNSDLVSSELVDEDRRIHKIYKNSFKHAYRQLDKLLARGKDEKSRLRWSGATACTCIIENKKLPNDKSEGWIHIANCGDVEAIVIMDNTRIKTKSKRNFRVLTRLHTINDCLKDRNFLEKSECKLIETSPGVKKIEGVFSITRALGLHGDKNVKKFLNPTPTVKSYKIEPNYACLIIATKGLWNALSYDKVAELVLQIMPNSSNRKNIERSISPSVKAMLSQYYYNKKNRIKEKTTVLQVLHDHKEENEIEEVKSIKVDKIVQEQPKYEEDTFDLEDDLNDDDNASSISVHHKKSTPNRSNASSLSYVEFKLSEHTIENKDSKSNTIIQNRSEEEFYRRSSRPRSVPHEYLHQTPAEEEEEKKVVAPRKSIVVEADKKPEEIKKPEQAETPIDEPDEQDKEKDEIVNEIKDDIEVQDAIEENVVEPIITNPNNGRRSIDNFKSNSDIYPTSKKNVLNNENYDLEFDLNEMKNYDKSNIKLLRPSSGKSVNSYDRLEKLNETAKEAEKKNYLLVTPNESKSVQITHYHLKKETRHFMEDRKLARRLDLSELLSERILASALIAGSTENITVNCILLPGCNI